MLTEVASVSRLGCAIVSHSWHAKPYDLWGRTNGYAKGDVTDVTLYQ